MNISNINPLLSIIVPIYNGEKILKKQLIELLKQTLSNIQVICINDGSTDNTLNVLREMETYDQRILVVNLSNNRGTHYARKMGVKYATGKYLTFLDIDDQLVDVNACRKAYNLLKKNDVDILHLSSKVDYLSFDNRDWVKKDLVNRLRVVKKRIKGNIFAEVIEKEKINLNLWGKIYRTSIVKKAFLEMSDDRLITAEDQYEFLVICYYSKSYKSSNENFYQYNFESGAYGTKLNLRQWENVTEKQTLKNIQNFFVSKNLEQKYKKQLLDMGKAFFINNVERWLNEVEQDVQGQAYNKLISDWGEEEVISYLSSTYRYNCSEVGKSLLNCNYYKSQKRNQKEKIRIAFYYRKLNNGGVERVLSILCNKLNKLKEYYNNVYDIILVVDEKHNNDYKLSEHIHIECLGIPSEDNYIKRYNKWRSIIDKYNIDIVLSSLYYDEISFWDMLAIKGAKTKPFFCLWYHNFSLLPYLWGNMNKNMEYVYRIADAIVTLSDVDSLFMSAFNTNVKMIYNPSTFNVEDKKNKSVNKEKKSILWLARISEEKHPLDAVKIMYYILKEVPDARLYIVGAGDKNILNKMVKLTKRYGLEKNIFFEGFSSHVSEYYEKVSIFMNTSEYEGFPMVIGEALAYSLPIISYELPWLVLYQHNQGVIQVPQGDCKLMAEKIIELLKSEEKAVSIGNKGNQRLQYLYGQHNICNEWIDFITGVVYKNKGIYDEEMYNEENMRMILKYMQLYLSDKGSRNNLVDFLNKPWKKAIVLYWLDRDLLKKKVREKLFSSPKMLWTLRMMYKGCRGVYRSFHK